MTSQKSSVKTFGYTFWSAIKSYFFIPLIGLVIMMIYCPFSASSELKNIVMVYMNQPAGSDIQKITDFYKFYLFDNQYGNTSFIFNFIFISFSVILAIRIFKFITDKKTVNVYYSLGITRKNLFMSNFLAGISMLFIVVALPFLCSALVNIPYLGSSKELWTATLYLIFNYFLIALVSFGITAAVASCVGTTIESLAFSGIILASLSAFISCVQTLMAIFVLGAPYRGDFLYAFFEDDSMPSKLQNFNPILFGNNDCFRMGELYRESTKDAFAWKAPNFWLLIIWLAVGIGIFLFGMYLFQKRKAEICGFMGKSRVLNFIVIFILGFTAYCGTIYISTSYTESSNSVAIGIIIGAVVYLVIYSIIIFVFMRNFKQLIKSMKSLVLHYGVVAVITVIFITGLFGYSSRIPDISDISSINISSVIANPVISAGQSYPSGEDIDFCGYFDFMDEFKTQEDFKFVTELHKTVIDDGRVSVSSDYGIPRDEQVEGCDFTITYTLKDGKTLERHYSGIKVGTLNKFLGIENTDLYDEIITNYLTEPIGEDDEDSVVNMKSYFQSSDTNISLIPSDMSFEYRLKLDDELKADFYNALAKDLVNQTAEQRYFSTEDSLGSIMILGFYDYAYNDKYYYDGSYSYSGDSEIEVQDDTLGLIEETDTAKKYELNSTQNSSDAWIQLTGDMTNTIRFLKENNMLDLLHNETEFVSADIISSVPSNQNNLCLSSYNLYGYNYYGSSLLFQGSKFQKTDSEGYSFYEYYCDSFPNSVKVTDKDVINQLLADSYSVYHNSKNGYFVRFTDKDSNYVVIYVPADKMPADIAEDVSNLPEVDSDDFNGIYYAY